MSNRSWFCASFRKENLGGKNRSFPLVTSARWSNDAIITISFSATSFYNQCTGVYFSLISTSYIKRKITTSLFQWAPKELLASFFKERNKVCLPVLGAAKAERGCNICCVSFCSASSELREWTANHTYQKRVSNIRRILGELRFVGYWRFQKSCILIILLLCYNPNILETLNLVLKLSLIYPFLASSVNRFVNRTFQDLLLFQLYKL